MPITTSPRLATILAATAAAGLGGVAIAGAAGGTSTTTSTTPSASQPRPNGGPGAGETALTGETKQKVEAAALAKVPGGTILRSETDRGGVYEAHVRKSDGSEVEVKVDKDFQVTAVEAGPAGGPGGGRGHGGPGGPGGRGLHADLSAVAKDLGVTTAKLQSAVDAARPAKGARDDKRGDFAADLAKALGEKTADVQAVLDANRPDRGAGRGPQADQSALVAALAKEFSISESKVQSALDALRKAHDADHSAKRADFYAAVATSLGKDTAAVKKAFEATP